MEKRAKERRQERRQVRRHPCEYARALAALRSYPDGQDWIGGWPADHARHVIGSRLGRVASAAAADYLGAARELARCRR